MPVIAFVVGHNRERPTQITYKRYWLRHWYPQDIPDCSMLIVLQLRNSHKAKLSTTCGVWQLCRNNALWIT